MSAGMTRIGKELMPLLVTFPLFIKINSAHAFPRAMDINSLKTSALGGVDYLGRKTIFINKLFCCLLVELYSLKDSKKSF